MKRLLFSLLLAALPAIVLGQTTHYIVTTAHPYPEAVRRLAREDFDPAVRGSARAHPFQHVLNGFDAELSDDQVKRLLATGEVEDIEPVVERHVMDDTIVPGVQTTTWGVAAVHAPDVWPVTKGLAINGSGPSHVAIIDTGIDYHAPELQRAYKGGHNFITGTDDPLDDFGHGTHVAGIIAAANDSQGVVGVAPDVDIYSLKVLDQCGSGSSANVMHALDWVLAKKTAIGGNWVVNLSLGSDTPSTAEQNAVTNAESAGVIIVAAAGNGYDDSTSLFFQTNGLSYPAGYPGVLSVGAIDSSKVVASFSQRGPDLQVVAPGVSVLSTVIGLSVNTSDGDSFLATTEEIVKNAATKEPLQGYCVPAPSVSGPFVFCGMGNPSDFPTSVKGKIALIERGTITFKAKAQNAQAAGAIGVIVYDNVPDDDPNHVGVAIFGDYPTPSSVPQFLPFALVRQQDGLALKAKPDVTIKIGFGLEGYALESGTSMATPHTAGAVALAWATAPTATSIEVQKAIVNNASDLGDPGVDNTYGHGLVNVLEAAKQLDPAGFGVSAQPQPPTGRAPGRGRH